VFSPEKESSFLPEAGVWFEYFYVDGKCTVNAVDFTDVPTLSSTCTVHSV
jgi:hypothetical protein